MADRIIPTEGMVLQYLRSASSDPLPARITHVWSSDRVGLEFYENGETVPVNDVEVVHPLDSVPQNRPFARFHPRPDVASERHLIGAEPEPEPEPALPSKSEERRAASKRK